MRLRLSLVLALLVSGLARADDLERSVAAACPTDGQPAHPAAAAAGAGEAGDACFARSLEARVGDVLDRSAALAEERAVALLEARAAERPDEVARAVDRRVERQLASLASTTARELPTRLAAPGPEGAVATRVARLAPCAVDADPLEVGSPAWWSGVALRSR